MIEIHKDAVGNVTGYFDKDKNVWVPPPPTDMEAEVLDESQAADADDAMEPDFDSMTKQQLSDWLTSAGEEVSPRDSKHELLEQAKNTFAASQE